MKPRRREDLRVLNSGTEQCGLVSKVHEATVLRVGDARVRVRRHAFGVRLHALLRVSEREGDGCDGAGRGRAGERAGESDAVGTVACISESGFGLSVGARQGAGTAVHVPSAEVMRSTLGSCTLSDLPCAIGASAARLALHSGLQ